MIQIDEAARVLGGVGLRLYLRLLALGVQMRSNSIEISDRWLYGDLGISKEGLTVAKRQIVRFVTVEVEDGIATRYGLPLPWLSAQNPMFPQQGALLNRAHRPGEQGTSAPENRAPLPYKTGHTAPLNRAECPEKQGGCPEKQGEVPFIAGRSAPENRAPATENQQVAGGSLIRSDQNQDHGFVSDPVIVRNIASVENLQNEQKEVASLLSSLLVDHMERHQPHGGGEKYPPERILARCLAIAPIETLKQTLETLSNEGRPAGKKFAWFVTIFLNRIHGIDPEVVKDTFKHVLEEKKLRTQPDGLFNEDPYNTAPEWLRKLA
jgi:hypothetical protein